MLRNIEVPWDRIQREVDILGENRLGTQNILEASLKPVDEVDETRRYCVLITLGKFISRHRIQLIERNKGGNVPNMTGDPISAS